MVQDSDTADRVAELPDYAVNIEDIRAAHARINPFAHYTPVMTCQAIDAIATRKIFFKCEQFQKGGAFKFRGACNAIFSLSDEEACRGVVTHSSGNHAVAIAMAANLRSTRAHIVLPTNTPRCKRDTAAACGAKIYPCAPSMDARERECVQIQAQLHCTLIPPYNHRHVIAGQGTVALEFLEQVPDLDAIIAPVSGGGLISGIAIAAKSIKPDILIFAAEPTGSNNAADVAAAKACGKLVSLPKPETIADGLQGRLGDLTWPPIRDLVSSVITVSDQEILHAMQLFFERMKVVVEPSGAAALAASLSSQFCESQKWNLSRVGIIISGGNLDLASSVIPAFWQLQT